MRLEFLSALHFLTIWPVSMPDDLPDDIWSRSMTYFPLVGFVVGVCLVVTHFILSLVWPATVVAAGVLAVWVLLTGALHLDGVADCCDGLLVAKPPEERLRILKDTHIGTFGVVGVVILLFLKFACLQVSMTNPAQMRITIMLAPVVSRWAMVCATVAYPYGRSGQSLGAMFASRVTRRNLWMSTLLAVLISGLVGGWLGLSALILAVLVTMGVANWTMTRIPGLTGDVYGTINELSELAVLLLAVAVV